MRFRFSSRACAFACVALVVGHVVAIAQSPRPLSIEDFYRIKTVGAPSLSPDAQWVAYTISTRIEANNGTQSDVWLAPSDASSPGRKVSGSASATNPRWTDDGRLQYNVGAQSVTIDPRAPDRVDTTVVQAGAPSARGGGRGGVRRSTVASPDG
jgi:dipeptidyl aminopeptidase/acylaminoacyl peptidase